MLKFVFWFLLAANGLLFAFHQGYLAPLIPSGREPARVANQLNAARIVLQSRPQAGNVAAAAAQPPGVLACMEIGNFSSAEAARFEARLAALPLDGKLARRPAQGASSHMVFIPPLQGKAEADRMTAELRRLGVTDYYVIPDGAQRWGISLGIFRSEEAARAHLVALSQKGVRSARLIEHRLAMNLTAFQLRQLDAGLKAEVDKIREEFPGQDARDCQ